MTTAAAVLPLKRLTQAKQRLAPTLSDTDRRALFTATATDVLATVARCESITRTVVVTSETVFEQLASQHGFELLEDTTQSSHSLAAARGVEHLLTTGTGVELIALLSGDCPTVSTEAIDRLIQMTSTNSVTVAIDRHGSGTNALGLNPPDLIAPSFGPNSSARHRQLAEAAGAEVKQLNLPPFAIDVDTPEDLRLLWQLLEQEKLTGAPATSSALRRLMPTLARELSATPI